MNEESQEYRLGQLVESVRRVEEKLEDHVNGEDNTFNLLFDKIDKLSEQVSLARHLLLFFKLAGATIVLALTFKLGDIRNLWRGFL